jgi:PhnB protein
LPARATIRGPVAPLFGALVDGGRVEMPLQRTAWSETYGMGADRFGIQWMVSYTGDVEFGQGGGS